MSEHAHRFAIVPAEVVGDARIGHAAFRVLALISTYASTEGWAWPEQDRLARTLGISRQAVGQSIDQLVDLGYIAVEAVPVEGAGARTRNRYALLYDRSLNLPGVQDRLARTGKTGLPGEQDGLARPHAQTLDTGTDQPEQTNGTEAAAARPLVKTVGNPRVQAFIDEARRLGLAWTPNGRDNKLIKESDADPALLARAYDDLVHRRWGDSWLQGAATLQQVVTHLALYASKASTRTNYKKGEVI